MSDKKDTTNLPAQRSNEQNAWVLLQKQCIAFIQSGFLPAHITHGAKTLQDAVARAVTIAWKGRELGIPPLQAFSSITVINGKPCLSAELMLALCYQRVAGFSATFTTPPDKQNQECTIVLKRANGQPQTFRFTMQDAQTAGVVKQGSPWTKFPAAMLRARAISAACRAVCPDAIMGCYTPEEMGGEVLEGEVVEQEAVIQRQEPDKTPGTASPAASVPEPTHRLGGTTDDYRRAQPGWESHPCTEAQIKRLYALGKKHGYRHEELKALAFDLFGKEHLEDLTKGQIQVLFEEFEGGTTGMPPAPAPAVGSADDIALAAEEAAQMDADSRQAEGR